MFIALEQETKKTRVRKRERDIKKGSNKINFSNGMGRQGG
jgi:hypothetical protein